MLTKIELKNFRNWENKIIEFSPKTTVIIGDNASGKTNILESIYLLSTGKSFKAGVEEEMITYEEEIGRVKGEVDETFLEVVLTRGTINLGTTREEKAPRKRLLVDNAGRRLVDFAGNLKSVLFIPSDMDLVTSSPGVRRRFLDSVISQVDREYRRVILSYEKGLRRRNKILIKIREEGIGRGSLIFWDKLLIKNGDYISKKREEFIEFVNSTKSLNSEDFSLEYDKSAISEARLERYKREEVAAGTTLVGPHRDDFIFKITKKKNQVDLSKYGSRGEQRMGVLWIKMAELKFIEDFTKQSPTLLLDDIFSELDHEHRSVVIDAIKDRQTIIATADEHFVEKGAKTRKILI